MDDASCSLGAKVRQCGADQLNRANQIGRNHVADLFVAQFFCGPKQAIARIADDHINSLEFCEGAINDGANYCVSVTSSTSGKKVLG